jgi:serine/threonine protein kinase
MAAFSLLTALFGSGKRISISKRFDLVSTAGPASTSKVWKAHDHKLGQIVCLKITRAKKGATEAKKASTNVKKASQPPAPKAPTEGKVLEALKGHPNIVRVLEHGLTSKEEQYVVMELIEGLGLNFLIETKNAQLQGNRVNFLTQLIEAVEYIHGQKYLHRDIRPRNVLVTKDNVVKLIDFELAIPNDTAFCRPGPVVGNANYLAPELIKRRAMDHRSDLFSLGVTAYEVFTGNLPWEKADSWQTALAHINRPGRPPRDFRADLDDRTNAFLIKAIARDPQERFQTAAQFKSALLALPRGD